MKKKFLLVLATVLFLVGSFSVASATPVDLELLLAVDVSGSIDGGEFTLQQTGYANAFQSTAVHDAIAGGTLGSIAASLVYWSSYNQQAVAVPWTLIDSAASSNTFASLINAAARPFSGNTGVGEALQYSANQFAGNGFDGTRQVIDLSGDGTDNSGGYTPIQGRDYALGLGIDTINALAIQNNSLVAYFNNNVIGGTNAFTSFVSSFDQFGTAVQSKIITEISGADPIPEPATMLLLGTGLVGVAGAARRRKKNQA